MGSANTPRIFIGHVSALALDIANAPLPENANLYSKIALVGSSAA